MGGFIVLCLIVGGLFMWWSSSKPKDDYKIREERIAVVQKAYEHNLKDCDRIYNSNGKYTQWRECQRDATIVRDAETDAIRHPKATTNDRYIGWREA